MRNDKHGFGNGRLVLLLGTAALLYAGCLDPHKLGFYHDDGIYVVSAQSIAKGSGYRIMSLPGEPAQTKYPPMYPLLLSLIWLASPVFPANAAGFLIPSVLATLCYLWLSERYMLGQLSASRAMSLWAIAIVAFNSRTAILATSALSEAVYVVFSIAALWAAESHMAKPGLRSGGISVVALAAAILTRTSGLSLVVAIAVFAIWRHKLFRMLPTLAVAATVSIIWNLWVSTHISETTNPSLAFYTSYIGDVRTTLLNPGQFLPLIGRNAFMLIPVSIPLVFLGFSYSWVAAHPDLLPATILLLLLTCGVFLLGFFRHVRVGLGLVHVYLVCYLGMHVLWPYSSYDRFLMPVFPFLALFFVTGARSLLESLGGLKRLEFHWASIAVALLLVSIFISCLYGNVSGLWNEAISSRRVFRMRAREDARLATWIREHTEPSAVLIGHPDPLYYLYTGRKAIGLGLSMSDAPSKLESLLEQIRNTGATYVIDNHRDLTTKFRPDIGLTDFTALLQARPESFSLVLSTGTAKIYRLEGLRPMR